MWHQARISKPENIQFERIRDEVTDVKILDNRLKVLLQNSPDFFTDKIAFALGNSLPKNPPVKNKDVLKDNHYVQNPWNPELLNKIASNNSVLFIGTGQTMVDLATGLHRRNHKGKMVAISRRGVLPMSQKNVDPYPSFYNEIKEYTEILPVFLGTETYKKCFNKRSGSTML